MKLSELLAIESDEEFTGKVHKHSVSVTECILVALLESNVEQLELDNRIVEAISIGAHDVLQSVAAREGIGESAVYKCVEGVVASAYIAGQLGVSNLVKLCKEELL